MYMHSQNLSQSKKPNSFVSLLLNSLSHSLLPRWFRVSTRSVLERCLGQCPDNWSTFGGHCYKSETSVMENWSGAYSKCLEMGAFLVDISSVEENDFMDSLNLPGRVWIGISDRAYEGTFLWERTGERATYTNWAGGEPNDYPPEGEDCGVIDGKYWNDVACSGNYKYVCKIGKVWLLIAVDFVMIPDVIVTCNISPETLNCLCLCRHR